MNLKCFFLTPTHRCTVSLRRYAWNDREPRFTCNASGGMSYHNAEVDIGEKEAEEQDRVERNHDRTDPRWPKHCTCGYEFKDSDEWQYRPSLLYARSDGGPPTTIRNAPPGAMWYAPWLSDAPQWQGPDGQCLIVRLPNGNDWMIEGRANNCDSPCVKCGKPYSQHAGGICRILYPGEQFDVNSHYYVDAKPHKCWIRHGEPPLITVDKNGVTCGAGAGSIVSGNYHGFLRNGELTNA